MNIKNAARHAFNLASCAVGGTLVTSALVMLALQTFATPPRAQPMSLAAEVATGAALGVGALLLGLGYTRYYGSGKFTNMVRRLLPGSSPNPPRP